jgi:hypothetical protein
MFYQTRKSMMHVLIDRGISVYVAGHPYDVNGQRQL